MGVNVSYRDQYITLPGSPTTLSWMAGTFYDGNPDPCGTVPYHSKIKQVSHSDIYGTLPLPPTIYQAGYYQNNIYKEPSFVAKTDDTGTHLMSYGDSNMKYYTGMDCSRIAVANTDYSSYNSQTGLYNTINIVALPSFKHQTVKRNMCLDEIPVNANYLLPLKDYYVFGTFLFACLFPFYSTEIIDYNNFLNTFQIYKTGGGDWYNGSVIYVKSDGTYTNTLGDDCLAIGNIPTSYNSPYTNGAILGSQDPQWVTLTTSFAQINTGVIPGYSNSELVLGTSRVGKSPGQYLEVNIGTEEAPIYKSMTVVGRKSLVSGLYTYWCIPQNAWYGTREPRDILTNKALSSYINSISFDLNHTQYEGTSLLGGHVKRKLDLASNVEYTLHCDKILNYLKGRKETYYSWGETSSPLQVPIAYIPTDTATFSEFDFDNEAIIVSATNTKVVAIEPDPELNMVENNVNVEDITITSNSNGKYYTAGFGQYASSKEFSNDKSMYASMSGMPLFHTSVWDENNLIWSALTEQEDTAAVYSPGEETHYIPVGEIGTKLYRIPEITDWNVTINAQALQGWSEVSIRLWELKWFPAENIYKWQVVGWVPMTQSGQLWQANLMSKITLQPGDLGNFSCGSVLKTTSWQGTYRNPITIRGNQYHYPEFKNPPSFFNVPSINFPDGTPSTTLKGYRFPMPALENLVFENISSTPSSVTYVSGEQDDGVGIKLAVKVGEYYKITNNNRYYKPYNSNYTGKMYVVDRDTNEYSPGQSGNYWCKNIVACYTQGLISYYDQATAKVTYNAYIPAMAKRNNLTLLIVMCPNLMTFTGKNNGYTQLPGIFNYTVRFDSDDGGKSWSYISTTLPSTDWIKDEWKVTY